MILRPMGQRIVNVFDINSLTLKGLVIEVFSGTVRRDVTSPANCKHKIKHAPPRSRIDP